MWVPKYIRDDRMGVDTPMPTQVLSNEEIFPRPQNKNQRAVEKLAMEWGEQNAKKVGMDRRDFMRSSMGLATMLLASNQVYGDYWEVAQAEAVDPAVTDEKYPKGEYFIMDVQSHFTNSWEVAADRGELTEDNPTGERNRAGFRSREFLQNMGFQLDESLEAYSFSNFIKEMFFDSETEMVVISGVPGREKQRDEDGRVLEGMERSQASLPSWLMSQRKKDLNDLARSTRALCQGNCAPNHYWDKKTNQPDYPALYEQIEREIKLYGIDSWKWYCHTDPARSGRGFQVDDEMSAKFIQKSRELGLKTISVHKGFSYQSRTLGHLANPKDMEKAALENPDFTFICYHSALKHGPNEPDYESLNEYDPVTGDFAWHKELMDIKIRNPQIDNLHCEIGSSFGLLAIEHPAMCQHLMGKNIKHYGADHVIWGTDCLWWGSPQWAVDLFKRFQFTDEMTEKFGYQKLTKEDKAKIFGLNAAKIYGVEVNAQRNALPGSALTQFKVEYQAEGGEPSNKFNGWVRQERRA